MVVDAEFDKGYICLLYMMQLLSTRNEGDLVLEVAQHLSETTVRAVALSTTDGVKRGDEVTATGRAYQCASR